MVYFARDPATSRIKIGYTANLYCRMLALRRVRPGLEVIAAAPGGRHAEHALHAMLIDHHVGSEWFEPAPKVEAAAIAVAEGWLKPAELPKVVSPLLREASLRGHCARRQRLAARPQDKAA